MKILVTGFDLWGSVRINPSWEMVKDLPTSVGIHTLKIVKIPVVYSQIKQSIKSAIDEFEPDLIITFGLADSIVKPRVESYGWNYGAGGRDASGVALNDVLDDNKNARVGYKTSFDYEFVKNWNLPESSYGSVDAKDFLCNALIYHIGAILEDKAVATPFMFTHVPSERTMSVRRLTAFAKKMIEKAVAELNEQLDFSEADRQQGSERQREQGAEARITPERQQADTEDDTEEVTEDDNRVIKTNLVTNASTRDYSWGGNGIFYRLNPVPRTAGDYAFEALVTSDKEFRLRVTYAGQNKEINIPSGTKRIRLVFKVTTPISEPDKVYFNSAVPEALNVTLARGSVKFGLLEEPTQSQDSVSEPETRREEPPESPASSDDRTIERNLITNASSDDYNWRGQSITYKASGTPKEGDVAFEAVINANKPFTLEITFNDVKKTQEMVAGDNTVRAVFNNAVVGSPVQVLLKNASRLVALNATIKGGTAKFGALE